jgi:hypothetical protein
MKTYDEIIRVSQMSGRGEHDESTHSIRQQQAANRAAAKALGGRIGHTFKLLDQSGFTALGKHGDAIVERVATGSSAGIIAPYSSRLGRNWWEGGNFFSKMNDVDGEVVDATAPHLDYRTDEGRMRWGMEFVMNERPALDGKRNGNKVADDLIRDGIPNRVSYGYRRNADPMGVKVDEDRPGKALVPEPEQARTVVRIFELAGKGHGAVAVCRVLNDAGVPGPTGGLWMPGTVGALVKNEVYLGVIKMGKRKSEVVHTPLVSRAAWLRAQSTRPVIRNGRLVGGVASGLLTCSGCQGPLSPLGSGDGRGHYGCRRSSSKGVCPRPVYVSKPAADDFVVGLVEDVLAGGRLAVSAATADVAALRATLEQANEELEAFCAVERATDAGFKANVDRRRADVDAAQVALDEADVAEAIDLPSSDEWQKLVDAKDVAGMRRVAGALIESVTVSPPLSRSKFAPIEDRFDVEWREA